MKTVQNYDLWNLKNVTCPYCNHEHKDDEIYWYYGHVTSSQHEDTEVREVECQSCEKPFETSMDVHNRNNGFTCRKMDCIKLKKKHKFEFTKIHTHTHEDGTLDYKGYECKECGEYKHKAISKKGKFLNDKQKTDYLRSISKIARPLTPDKLMELYSYNLQFGNKSAIIINTKEADGNWEIGQNLKSIVQSLGAKVIPLDKSDYYLTSTIPQLQKGNINFEIRVHSAIVELKFEFPRDHKLSYLETKQAQTTFQKIESELVKIYPQITYREESELTWGRPNLNSVKTNEQKIALIRKYPSADLGGDYNRRDKNKKILNNGDIRYFYDYDNKLCRGEIFHNINNMWWVLTTDNYYNKSSGELFEYHDQITVKKPVDQLAMLKSVLKNAVAKEEFEKCVKIKKQILKLTGES